MLKIYLTLRVHNKKQLQSYKYPPVRISVTLTAVFILLIFYTFPLPKNFVLFSQFFTAGTSSVVTSGSASGVGVEVAPGVKVGSASGVSVGSASGAIISDR